MTQALMHVQRLCQLITLLLFVFSNSCGNLFAAPPKEIQVLAEQLASVDLKERRDAAYGLASKGEQALDALDALIIALGDRDTQVWFQSINTIAKLGADASSAVEAVAEHLESDTEQRRYRAAWCLARIGVEAMPAIEKSLQNGDSRCRLAAIQSCGWMVDLPEKVVPLLVDSLQDSDESVAREAVQSLTRLAAQDALAGALDDSRENIQILAAQGLRLLDQVPVSANARLLNLAQSENSALSAAAISAIGKTTISDSLLKEVIRQSMQNQDSASVNALILLLRSRPDSNDIIASICDGLKNDSAEVRGVAAQVLARAGFYSKFASDSLIEALGKSEEETPLIVKALGSMGNQVVDDLLLYPSSTNESTESFSTAIALLGPSIGPRLLSALESSEIPVRVRATLAISKMDSLPDGSIPALVATLQSPDVNLQVASVQAISRADQIPQSALKTIRSLSSSDDDYLRGRVILAVSQLDLKDEDNLAVLEKGLTDSSSEVRQAMLDIIDQVDLPEPSIVAFFKQCLNDSGESIRLRTLQAIGRMENTSPQLESVILELLEDPEPTVQAASVMALKSLSVRSTQVKQVLVSKLKVSNEKILLAVLETLRDYKGGSTTGIPEVVKLIGHPSGSIRGAAIHCFADLEDNPEQVLPVLLPLLEDEDWAVRRDAASKIGAYGTLAKAAVPVLFNMLSSEEDEEIARNALREIDSAGPEALDVLLNGLGSEDRRIRFYAMFLIGKIGPEAKVAIPRLREMMNDSDSGRFKETIQQSINRIEGK